MKKLLIAVLLSFYSFSSYAYELGNKSNFDSSGDFDAPNGYGDTECTREKAHKKAVYVIHYQRKRITIKDKSGNERAEKHFACVLSQKQKIKWKAGKNVDSFKISFYEDKDKQVEGCPANKLKICEKMRDEFKKVHILKGRKLRNSKVPELFSYTITIKPSNNKDCSLGEVDDQNNRNNTCVLDPKLKILKM